ncbi:MAG: NERD domain-containing protein, partial [Bacteroidaceae bacterium]|nr:NERD domain-containing protein [Bacteroidaceae bacterium]
MIYLRCNRSKIIGSWGEKKVAFALKFLNGNYHAFNDVLISTGNYTAQIDHVVTSPFGIFVIETKRYKGDIYGGENSEKWTQNIFGHKYEMTNPVRQNIWHVRALQNTMPTFLYGQYISLVVFLGKSRLHVSVNNDTNVIRYWQLLFRIWSYKERILTEEQIADFELALKSRMLNSKSSRRAHVKRVKAACKMRTKREKAGLCPRCGGELVLRDGKFGK